MKILIIGFQRSGTTLIRRLFDIHPDVQRMVHERRVLNNKNLVKRIRRERRLKIVSKDGFSIDINIDKNWGEKVPWVSDGKDIIRYTNKWLEEFGEDARIIHITRHPKDVANSNKKKFNVSNTESLQKSSMSNVRNVLSNDSRYIEVTFEDLVTKPRRTLKGLFKFCKLKHTESVLNEVASAKKDKLRYFDGINPDRAFAFKKK